MEKQKKTLKISLKKAILIFFIILAILIGVSIIVWNHFKRNKTDNTKLLSETEIINSNEYKRYDTIEYIGEDGTLGVIIYKEDDKTDFELVNFNGETISNFEGFKHCENVDNDKILIGKNMFYNLIDTKGNIILEEISISKPQIISDNEQDKFIVFQKDEKVKIINLETKETLSNYEYEEVCNYKTANGLIKVKKDGKYGFIDENGNIIINCEYENLADYFLEDMIVAKKDGKCGCIDKNGNIVINFEYDRIGNFSEGVVSAKKGNKIGFLDKEGNIIIDFKYEYIYDEESNKDDFEFFTDMPEFKEDVVAVFKDEQGFFIDKSGNKAIDFETEFNITHLNRAFNNGILVGQKNGKTGVFDKTGKIVVDFIYDDIQNYEDIELLPAKLNGKNGCIDKKGNTIINFEFDLPVDFDYNYDGIIDEYAIVQKNNKYGCIDKKGNILVQFKYDYLMKTANNNLLLARKNDKLGIINTSGEIIVAFEYDDLSSYNIQFILANHLELKPRLLGAFKKGDIWEILDIEGNKVGTYKSKSK